MSVENSNLESQSDEVEALSAIYGKDFTSHDQQTFDLRICCDAEKWWAVTISVLLPVTYPTECPPEFEIHTECLSGGELDAIYRELDVLWKDNEGGSILYIWVEKIREMLFEKYDSAKLFIESTEEEKKRESALVALLRDAVVSATEEIPDEADFSYEAYTPTTVHDTEPSVEVPNILSGETVTLKKSTFQGHAAVVHTMQEVKAVLRKLKENKKVAQATHNILAYRLTGVKENSFIQDYADDGEVNAGGRILHLLQIMDVQNIVVVVSRWYGGILLGPDRFRLINNAAREVIVNSGVYVPKQEKSRTKKKR